MKRRQERRVEIETGKKWKDGRKGGGGDKKEVKRRWEGREREPVGDRKKSGSKGSWEVV